MTFNYKSVLSYLVLAHRIMYQDLDSSNNHTLYPPFSLLYIYLGLVSLRVGRSGVVMTAFPVIGTQYLTQCRQRMLD